MGAHVNARTITVVGAIAASLVIACNGWLVVQTVTEHLAPALMALAAVVGLGAAGLLAYLAITPLRAPDGPFAEPLLEPFALRREAAERQSL